ALYRQVDESAARSRSVRPRGETLTSVDETKVIAPSGELDMASVPEFGRVLAEVSHESTGRVIVDLSAVDFIDSRGLRPSLELHEELVREQRSLAIVAPRGTRAAELL